MQKKKLLRTKIQIKMGKIGLIIKREYSSRVKKKSFLLMTILGPILMVGFLGGAMWFGMQDEGNKKIAIIDESNLMVPNDLPGELDNDTIQISRENDYEFTLYRGVDDDATKLVESDQYDYAIWIPADLLKINKVKFYYKEFPSSRTETKINLFANSVSQKIKLELLRKSDTSKVALTDAQYASISKEISVGKENIDKDVQDEGNREKAAVGLIFGIIIYIFIFMYGVQVMKGVIEEKSNRIVEVIVSSVKPFELMMGKIIGIMLVGLTQFLVWVLLSTILFGILSATVLTDTLDPTVQANMMGQMDQLGAGSDIAHLIFHEINWPLMLGMFIFYFIGGYLLYGSLMAAVGAAVDSETDTQQFMLPISAPLIFAYIIAVSAVENPNSPAAVWCSQIPFTSPVVMLVRVAMGGEGLLLQIIVSMVLLIGTFIGTTWVASKIYRTGILMYGKKASYKELFKWLKLK